MRNLNKYLWLVIAMLSITACDDDYLERFPLDTLTNETYWNSDNDLKNYAAGLYGVFGSGQNLWDDNLSDNLAPETFNRTAAGLHTASTGQWSYSFLRSCNFFLENFDKSTNVTQAAKKQYKGEILLMRAYWTASRVRTYGDISYSTKVLTQRDEDVLFGPRMPRKEVMTQVLADLKEAAELIPADESESGRLTKNAALGFMARICLHEGTYRKYHGLGDANEFLQVAATAAKEIMDSGKNALYSTGDPAVDYRDMFTQLDLNGNPEAIFYAAYIPDVRGHDFIRYIVESTANGATKDLINDYLCTDGKPIDLSSLYQGDDDFEGEFEDRDPRMAQTIVPKSENFFDSAFGGTTPTTEPRLKGLAFGNSSATTTGYHVHKYYSEAETFKYAKAETDLPILRFAEVLLVYAEAMAELGQADQTVIDESINLLRARVGMIPMVIADLERDPNSDMIAGAGYGVDVSVLIEEIRRERRIELAGEGFRYDDMMRWKAGKFFEKRVLGVKWDAVKGFAEPSGEALYDASDDAAVLLDDDGYVWVYKNALPGGRIFEDPKHYLRAVPREELIMNPALEPQNPGWE